MQTNLPARTTPAEIQGATMGKMLEANLKRIESLIPSHLDTGKLLRLAMNEMQRIPKLRDCTPASVLSGVMQSAALGLEIGPHLGQAFLVPFYDGRSRAMIAQFVPGYRGLVQLLHRSGQIKTLDAHVVFVGDAFEFRYGLDQRLVHVPNLESPERERRNWEDMKAAYAVCRTTTGGEYFIVRSRADIEKIRGRSQAAGSSFSPWSHADDWVWMVRKTMVKQLHRYLPASIEFQTAVALDDAAESGQAQPLAEGIDWGAMDREMFSGAQDAVGEDVPPATPTTATGALRDKLSRQQQAPPLASAADPAGGGAAQADTATSAASPLASAGDDGPVVGTLHVPSEDCPTLDAAVALATARVTSGAWDEAQVLVVGDLSYDGEIPAYIKIASVPKRRRGSVDTVLPPVGKE